MFRKPWNANKDGALDTVMSEYDNDVVDAEVEEPVEQDNNTEVVHESN